MGTGRRSVLVDSFPGINPGLASSEILPNQRYFDRPLASKSRLAFRSQIGGVDRVLSGFACVRYRYLETSPYIKLELCPSFDRSINRSPSHSSDDSLKIGSGMVLFGTSATTVGGIASE